jgi:hypothetical protein
MDVDYDIAMAMETTKDESADLSQTRVLLALMDEVKAHRKESQELREYIFTIIQQNSSGLVYQETPPYSVIRTPHSNAVDPSFRLWLSGQT